MLQHFFGFVYLSAISQLVSLAGTQAECPVQLNPRRAVVMYGDSVAVNCSTSVLHRGIGWEASEGGVPKTENQNVVTWRVSELTEWDIKPYCYLNYQTGDPCEVELPVTVYKTPDSVSISPVGHSGPMMEGRWYELQCDVHDVAPVQHLTVRWYKGQTLLNQTIFTDTSKTPENKTVKLLIRPDRDDDGAQYWCETELDLGAEGPQPHPKTSSNPLNVEVYYKPRHSSSTETIIKKDEVILDCTVKANPAPTYTWDHLKEKISSSALKSSTLSPGNYTCIATNTLGNDSKVFIVESTDSQCPVQIIPRRAVVRYGDDVSADCKTSVLHRGIGWEASEGAVPMIRNQSLITWRVSELTEWVIKPFCYINYQTGDPCSVELPVTVYKTPDSVSISPVGHSGPMMKGRWYELQCDVHDVAPVQYLTVRWYKGETLLNQTIFTDTSKTPVNETVKLLIRPDRDDDGAQYWCEAELDLGAEGPQPHPKNSSKPLSITVHFAPKIKFCSDWSPLTETSLDLYPLNFSSVEGNPRPDIFWRRHKLSSLVNSSMPLTKYDSGRYEIIARNDLDGVSCFVNITVEYPPELNCTKIYEVKEKALFKPCIANGLPKPQLSLSKNGTTIQQKFHTDWNDSGLYQLTAHNQHGTITSSFTINVLYAPVFHDSQEKFVVEGDSNITLECNSTGNPEPEVWWSFKKQNISTGRRHLNIERATSTNAGVYTCSATNKFGHRDKTFIVEIKDDFPKSILIAVLVVLALLVLIIILVVLMRRRRKLGRYEIQSAKPHEMQLLSNGGPK